MNLQKIHHVPMRSGLLDLHVHLDGSLSLANVHHLAEMQEIPIPDEQELTKMLQAPPDCRDLNGYLARFDFPLTLLQSEKAMSDSVCQLLREQEQQGLIYSEIRFAPQLHRQRGMSQEQAVKAAVHGLLQFKEEQGNLDAALILCCMRGPDNYRENMETIEVAEKFLGKGICAVDLAGAEARYPTELFAEIFAAARARGIPFTVHAGEAAGPKSIRTALSWGARRIGHGIRCVEDTDLMHILAREGVALELCPTSNLNTQIFERIEEYPLKKLLDAGICVTINTDNMMVSNVTEQRELEQLTHTFHLEEQTVRQLLENSVSAAFAPDAVKTKLRDKILEYWS